MFVHFICSCSCTRPWRVKCTTHFWLRTRNKLANIHYFDGFGRPRVYSALRVESLEERLKNSDYSISTVKSDLEKLIKNSNGWLKVRKGWVNKNSSIDASKFVKLF